MNDDDESRNLLAECREFELKDFERPEVREYIKASGLIWGIDDDENARETLFFGRALLQEVVNGRAAEWGQVKGAKVHYNSDPRKDSLEWLFAAIQTLKGHCEYKAAGE